MSNKPRGESGDFHPAAILLFLGVLKVIIWLCCDLSTTLIRV